MDATKLPVTWGICLILYMTLVPVLSLDGCVQDKPGPGKCVNASNPNAADTTGVAGTIQTKLTCGQQEAFSILETPWLSFTTVSCVTFTFRRLNPYDLDVFFEVRDSHVQTIVNRSLANHQNNKTYSQKFTVHALIGKIQFRAFGGGLNQSSHLKVYPVSVSTGQCLEPNGIIVTATAAPKATTPLSTTAKTTKTSVRLTTPPTPRTGPPTPPTATTTTAAATASTSSSVDGSVQPRASVKLIIDDGNTSGSTLLTPYSSTAQTLKQRGDDDDDTKPDIGIVIGAIIGTILAVVATIATFLVYRKWFRKSQVHPGLYKESTPMDITRPDTARSLRLSV